MKFKNLDGKILANRIEVIVGEKEHGDYYVFFPFSEYKLESDFDLDLFEEHGEKEFLFMTINDGLLTIYLEEGESTNFGKTLSESINSTIVRR